MFKYFDVRGGNINGTRTLLDQTAIDVNDTSCGGTATNNNVWGQGKLDIYAAVTRSTRDQKGTLGGTITAHGSGAAILGATITAVGPAPQQDNFMTTTVLLQPRGQVQCQSKAS